MEFIARVGVNSLPFNITGITKWHRETLGSTQFRLSEVKIKGNKLIGVNLRLFIKLSFIMQFFNPLRSLPVAAEEKNQ